MTGSKVLPPSSNGTQEHAASTIVSGAHMPRKLLPPLGAAPAASSCNVPQPSPAPAPAPTATLKPRRSTKRLSVDTTRHNKFAGALELSARGFLPQSVDYSFNVDGPHLLTWSSSIRSRAQAALAAMHGDVHEEVLEDETFTLPRGSCCLYTFPTVTTADDPHPFLPSGDGIELLCAMLLQLLEDSDESCCFDITDQVGAFPIHALMVCNTDASLALCSRLYAARPRLLTQVHALSGPYHGESSLHICCVNKRQQMLLDLLHLAQRDLTARELEKLLKSQTSGSFFSNLPMRFYGSTALSYACCFDMRAAVIEMLGTGLVSLNDREDGCRLSGFLPLHATVASSQEEMFDWLTSNLPREWRASTDQVSKVGHLRETHELASLTPLQLSASFGDRSMVRHLLRRQCEVMWVWGPVTQYALSLEGVDSAGRGSGDVMELIVRIGARRRTTEMLLDSFMNGFIYTLYQQKWRRFGRRIHYARRAADFVLVVSLAVQTLYIKAHPEDLASVQPLSYLHFALIALAVEEEARTTRAFMREESSAEGDARIPLAARLRKAAAFLSQHRIHLQLLAFIFVLAGAMLVLGVVPLPPRDTLEVTNDWLPQRSASAGSSSSSASSPPSLRSLKSVGALGGAHELSTWASWEITNEGAWALLWLMHAAALLLLVVHLATLAFLPFESLNVLVNTLIEMLRKDVSTYLTVFLWLFAGFYLALYILYPRSGAATLPQVQSFNTVLSSVLDLLRLSVLGEGVDFDFLTDSFGAMSMAQLVCLCLWLLLYYMWLILSVILMLNLLIAMLTNTFDDAYDEATLKSRHSTACVNRILTRAPLRCSSLNSCVHRRYSLLNGPHV